MTSAICCPVIETPLIVTVSLPHVPCDVDPSPYRIVKAAPKFLYEEDDDGVKVPELLQSTPFPHWAFESTTQKSLEPVSIMTVCCCLFEPTETLDAYDGPSLINDNEMESLFSHQSPRQQTQDCRLF